MPNGYVPQIKVGGPTYFQEQLPSGLIGTAPRVGAVAVPGALPGRRMPYQTMRQPGGGGPEEFAKDVIEALPLPPVVEDVAKALIQFLPGEQAIRATGIGGAAMTGAMVQYGIRGPGVPEPAPGTVMNQWSVVVNSKTVGTFRIYFFKMFDGYTLMYNPAKRQWKRWRTKGVKPIYLGKNPTLGVAVKAQRKLDRLWRTVAKRTKALKLA